MSEQKHIQEILRQQKDYFFSGSTKPYHFRIKQLKKLRQLIQSNEKHIFKALHQDLRKPEMEAFTGEVGFVLEEIDFAIKHLKKWMKKRKVKTPLMYKPAQSFYFYEPLGNVLIIGPWNYPFQLLLSPLVGAIAAGNTTMLKASELAPHTSALLKTMIKDNFSEKYIALFEGGVKTSTLLLQEKFDHIFFTGSTHVGRIVMQAAAKHLTPVTLELGGKSPCVVDKETNLELTARRIVWGKFFNAGQTCVAPDYILVQKSIKEALIEQLKKEIELFYSENPKKSTDYPRIINENHFQRLLSYLEGQNIAFGGKHDLEDLYIEPTLLVDVDSKASIMQDEIFGPILPILEYDRIDEVIQFINERPKPLALYLFSQCQVAVKRILQGTSSGGVCLNDTLLHMSTNFLPFGGVGDSGMGAYHGKASFEVFSHKKPVLRKGFSLDLKVRYAPYNKISLANLKKIFKLIG